VSFATEAIAYLDAELDESSETMTLTPGDLPFAVVVSDEQSDASIDGPSGAGADVMLEVVAREVMHLGKLYTRGDGTRYTAVKVDRQAIRGDYVCTIAVMQGHRR